MNTYRVQAVGVGGGKYAMAVLRGKDFVCWATSPGDRLRFKSPAAAQADYERRRPAPERGLGSPEELARLLKA